MNKHTKSLTLIHKIRLKNLKSILNPQYDDSADQVSVDLGNIGIDKKHVDLLLSGERGIGDNLARSIEQALNKEKYWLDKGIETIDKEKKQETFNFLEEELKGLKRVGVKLDTNTPNTTSSQVPLLTSSQIVPYIDKGNVPPSVRFLSEPFEGASQVKCFVYSDETNHNAPMLPKGTHYKILPMYITKLPCIAAIYVDGDVVVGLYDQNKSGKMITFSNSETKVLDDGCRFLGRVCEIKPPLFESAF